MSTIGFAWVRVRRQRKAREQQ